MCCFAWLLASRPFRRCVPASSASTTSSNRSSGRKFRQRERRSDASSSSQRSSLDDVLRASTLSAARPILANLPVQPLTEREVIVLVQSWKTIQKQFIETGVIIFLRCANSLPI